MRLYSFRIKALIFHTVSTIEYTEWGIKITFLSTWGAPLIGVSAKTGTHCTRKFGDKVNQFFGLIFF